MSNSVSTLSKSPEISMPDNQNNSKLKWIEKFVGVMDDRFRLPGTRFHFGLDPVIGLIPFVGELVTFVLTGAMVLTMAKHGASRKVVILMMLNLMLDSIIGSIPLIGNIFDFYYKANRRNLNLLKKHYEEGKYQGSGNGILLAVVIGLIVMFSLLIYGLWKLTEWVFTSVGDWV